MKFAIPIADGKLAIHFCHSQTFAIIEFEKGEVKSKEYLRPPPHEPGVLPQWLSEVGTDAVIAGGIGNRAISLFEEYGIKVLTGASELEPEELVKKYLDHTLVAGVNLCDQ